MYGAVLCVAIFLTAAAIPPAEQPPNLETAYEHLKEAVSKNDHSAVKTLAVDAHALAEGVMKEAPPEVESLQENWKNRVKFAGDVQKYAEFSLYSSAVQTAPAQSVEMFETLEQLNPRSQYLAHGYGPYYVALTKAGKADRIPAIAEKAVENFPNEEDSLAVLAESALNRKQTDRAAGYAERVIKAMSSHTPPEGVAAGDWERKRSTLLGRSYWTAGVIHGEKSQHFQANQDLRAALPYVKGNETMAAAAYFYLGVSNYYLGRQTLNRAQILEGAQFSQQAAAIAGPYQRQAWTNAHLMKAEADKMLARK
jgi:tetratricopeptide (TPR) repeat protein